MAAVFEESGILPTDPGQALPSLFPSFLPSLIHAFTHSFINLSNHLFSAIVIRWVSVNLLSQLQQPTKSAWVHCHPTASKLGP